MRSSAPIDAAPPTTRRVYRSAGLRTFGLVFPPCFAAVMLAFLALSWGAWDMAALVAFGLALAAFTGLRFTRAGVYPEPGGVRVVNLVRTRHLRWAEIAEFRLGGRGASQVALRRPGALAVPVFGIQQRRFELWLDRRTEGHELIDELNALVRWHQAHAG